jgi:hypothetical protein
MSKFTNFLSADFLPPETWKLTKPLVFMCEPVEHYTELMQLAPKNITIYGDHLLEITAPVGYTSDLASVPKFLWWLVAPFDIARAAVIHDYLYDAIDAQSPCTPILYKKRIRKAADDVFLLAMTASEPKIANWKIKLCYTAVRIFGGFNIKGYNNV